MKTIFSTLFLLTIAIGCQNENNGTKNSGAVNKVNTSISTDSDIKQKDTILLLDNFSKDISENELIKLFNIKKYDPEALTVKQYNQYLNPKFSITKKQFYKRGKDYYILSVLGLLLENGNHFDTGPSYIACFKLVNDEWRSVNKPLKVDGSSMWGNCDEVKKIEKFGENYICVSLEGGQGNQGFMEGKISYYGLNDNNELKLIFSGLAYSSDGGAGGDTNDEYEYKFKPSKNSKYYLLEMKKKSNNRVVKRQPLKFNYKTMKYE
jgi:hypothetical protein